MSPNVDVFGISDRVKQIYALVAYGVVCQIMNIFGIVTNIINIMCFTKQGFEDSVNISLLGLAVSDLGSLITMVWTAISLPSTILAADLPFEPTEVAYVTTAVIHWSFTRVSSCITAMITVERCLCITAPLKIKSIITPKRASVTTCCVFIIFFFSGFPVYAVNKLTTKFSPLRNKTIVGLVSTGDRRNVEMITYTINNFVIPFSSFTIIVVCAAILSFKLQSQSKWRLKTLKHSQVERASTRNQKAAKMIVMISILFIVCFVPVSITMMAIVLLPELSVNGKYVNLSLIIAGIGYIMESVNSSMNIFIYYKMSSNYREVFCKLFFNKPIQIYATQDVKN